MYHEPSRLTDTDVVLIETLTWEAHVILAAIKMQNIRVKLRFKSANLVDYLKNSQTAIGTKTKLGNSK